MKKEYNFKEFFKYANKKQIIKAYENLTESEKESFISEIDSKIIQKKQIIEKKAIYLKEKQNEVLNLIKDIRISNKKLNPIIDDYLDSVEKKYA